MMSSVGGVASKLTRAVGSAATMTTEAAGALGGAAVNGVIGGLTGAVTGVQRGLGRGSHSTPAAALTLGALGAAGLVEWPLLLAVGGTALVLRQLNHAAPAPAPVQPLASVKPTTSAQPPRSPQPKKTARPKKTTQPKKTPARPARSSRTRTSR